MEKKRLTEVSHQWQADAIKSALSAEGIDCDVIQKAREYSSLVSGIDSGHSEVWVAHDQFIQASRVLSNMSSSNIEDSADAIPNIPKNYFRRVIIFSLVGIIFLPGVFNLIATRNWMELRAQPASFSRKFFATVILILGWVMAIYAWHFFFKIYQT